jgi:hypothetical protein
MLWARPWGMSSWLKVQSNHDKDINTKNILVFHMLKDKRGWREKQVDGDNMLIGEITIEDWILRSRHSH